MAPKGPKRKRGKYHIENPTKDDCLWCSKKVGSATAVRCSVCNQAYHNKCSIQCGSMESTGAFRKCCDPTFKSQLTQDINNDVVYSDDDSCNSDGESSDSNDSDSTVIQKDEDKGASPITKHDLLSLSKSIKKAIKKSQNSLAKRIDVLTEAVSTVTTIANQNKADIAQIKGELIEQKNQMSVLSDACNANAAKISLIE